RRARLKFEADLAVGLLDEERLEAAPLLGHESVQEIGAPGREQLLHLLALDRLLQDQAAGAEIAAALRSDRVLAGVDHAVLEHPPAVLGTGAERLLGAEIRSLLALARSLAKVELGAQLVVQFHDRGERLA